MTNKKKNTAIVFSSLFAAIISVSCFIQIPLPGGIPIVLQDMFALLSGMLLGPLYGGISIIIFFILACIGLPVFSGKAGLNVLIASPTCGFLWGYLIAAILAGILLNIFLSKKKKHNTIKSYVVIAIVAVLATVVLFACGIVGFMLVSQTTLTKAIVVILIPFIPGNLVKIVLLVLLTKKFRPVIVQYL